MLRLLGVVAAGCCIGAVATGCSSVAPPAYDTDPRVVRLRAADGATLDFAVTLGMPTVPGSPPGDEARHAAPLDAKDLQNELLRVIRDEGVFRAVTPSDATALDAQIQQGWQRRDDLVLQVDVRRADVTYEGINGWFYPNLFVWFYAWAPSWWIADETYAANLEVEARLVSVHSGRTVFQRQFRPTIERDLDDFDRGWGLFATIFPGSLDAEDWRGVAELLVPHVIHELKVELFEAARSELPTVVASPSFEQDMSKTLYLGVGVTAQKSYLVKNAAWAANDAEALGAALQSGLGLDARNIQLLTDAQATKENILGAVRDFLATRARPGDTLICYVGGRGYVTPDGRPAIVPYFFEPRTAAADALPLDDLLAALDGVPAQVVLVLDVGWAGDVAGRGVQYLQDIEHGTCGPDAFARSGSDRRLCLSAAGPGDGAYEIDEERHSLLTHYLLTGLQGVADADNDGQVTAAEVAAYAARETAQQAGLEGRRQTPTVLGAAPGAVLAHLREGAGNGR